MLGGTHPNHEDNWYTIDGPSPDDPDNENIHSLKDFAEKLGLATKDGTTINFRSCHGGLIAGEVAKWSGRPTTGWTGEVKSYPYGKPEDGKAAYYGQDVYLIYDSNGNLVDSISASVYYGNYGEDHPKAWPNKGH
jgi:hypothetical protein